MADLAIPLAILRRRILGLVVVAVSDTIPVHALGTSDRVRGLGCCVVVRRLRLRSVGCVN